MISRIWRSPKRNTFSKSAASPASTAPVWAPAAIIMRISSSPIWGVTAEMPRARLVRVLKSWSRLTTGERASSTSRTGRETANATRSERRQAMFLGTVSPNNSRSVVTPAVAAKTARDLLVIRFKASTVARAAAAVFTRLLPNSTVAKKRSGRWMMWETRSAPGRPLRTRCMRRALGRAINAVSDAEKNPDRTRHTTNNANLHESPASISGSHLQGPRKVAPWQYRARSR